MKRSTSLAGIIILVVLQAVISCRKEFSCKNCTGTSEPPVAIAGPDQVITLPTDSVLLNGSASSDPDGTISAWRWTKISGPASFFINNPDQPETIVRNLVAGDYIFELRVTGIGGLSAKDIVQVHVMEHSAADRPPLANAGPDQSIILPAGPLTLDGSGSTDPDNNIVAYWWTKISGPTSFSLADQTAVQTQVNDLSQGIYQFELKVTDATGLFDYDTTQVIVLSPTQSCPQCRIVFVSDRDGNPEIYTCNPDGSGIQRLTNHGSNDDMPAWSPDGRRIAFVSDRSGITELYVMDADGSNVVQRTSLGESSYDPAWSPDGTKIVFSTLSNGSSNIWVHDLSSGMNSLLFERPGWEGQPAWSPDGTKIALVSDWLAYDFVWDIYTINADGSGFTPLTGNIFDQQNYLYPSWSPNGTKLAFAIREEIGINQFHTRVGVANPDGSGITELRPGAVSWTRTSWSPDGGRIIYSSWSGQRVDVAWVSADGLAWGTIVENAWNADWAKR